jgi:hypothetical protein
MTNKGMNILLGNLRLKRPFKRLTVGRIIYIENVELTELACDLWWVDDKGDPLAL